MEKSVSFSSEVKEELLKRSGKEHCNLAEITALLLCCGHRFDYVNHKYSIVVWTETEPTALKLEKLLWKTFQVRALFTTKKNAYSGNQTTYTISIKNSAQALKIISAIQTSENFGKFDSDGFVLDVNILQNDCCKRAYLRGAFMAAGSISDPHRSYHFEIACAHKYVAIQIVHLMKYFEIYAKTVARKGKYVVYIKEGEGIIDILKVMEAGVSLMKMENIRILKGMSNYYNRQVNCEAANIKKTVTTSHRQIEDIQTIMKFKGVEYLPEKLRDIALVRVQNPDLSLQELGKLLIPPLGKSGVNHRLRKISQIAQELYYESEK